MLTHKERGECSVMQEWTKGISLMQQSVLLTAVRGPDGLPKEHVAKKLLRWLRRTFLLLAFTREILPRPYSSGGGSFTGPSMDTEEPLEPDDEVVQKAFDREAWKTMAAYATEYIGCMDEMPMHFHFHLIHAAQIIGYKHPDEWTRAWWKEFYLRLVNAHHLFPESEELMDLRLGDSEAAWRAREQLIATPKKQETIVDVLRRTYPDKDWLEKIRQTTKTMLASSDSRIPSEQQAEVFKFVDEIFGFNKKATPVTPTQPKNADGGRPGSPAVGE